jgi:AcrR family transcriptional regulator
MSAAATDTEKRIVDAAAELFGERGYANTTTRAIAERAEVNEVTLFRKFGSKRGILEALAKSWTENMAGFAVAELPEPEDTRGTLTALAKIEVAQSTAAGPAAMRLVLDARFVGEISDMMASGPTDNLAGLAEYIGQRQAAGDLRDDLDPRVMAEAFFSLTSQAIMSRQVLTGTSAPEYGVPFDTASVQLLEIFLSGTAAGSRS